MMNQASQYRVPGFRVSIVIAVCLSVLCVAAFDCNAAVITFSTQLSSQSARPPSIGAGGSGIASANVDLATGAFSISGTSASLLPAVEVSIRGPNSPPADEMGPLILDLSFTTVHQSLGDGFDSSFSGNTVFDGTQMAELLAGQYFLAVHTGYMGKGGPDVGGSLIVPEPSALAAAYLLALTLLIRRRVSRDTRKEPA